ncbi:hypothetical protein GQ54DRAFT_331090 [Martensiomyces pterosporus]|nr:hypothetical protein GQ54DRAFT_331090 [Martensiomyces pterosporus]
MRCFLILVCAVCVAVCCVHGLTDDQKKAISRLQQWIDGSKIGSVEERKYFRTLALYLNDRTAMEAMLTDPDSTSYKLGLISLAQAIKAYAWLERSDQALMQQFQAVANRLKTILTQ